MRLPRLLYGCCCRCGCCCCCCCCLHACDTARRGRRIYVSLHSNANTNATRQLDRRRRSNQKPRHVFMLMSTPSKNAAHHRTTCIPPSPRQPSSFRRPPSYNQSNKPSSSAAPNLATGETEFTPSIGHCSPRFSNQPTNQIKSNQIKSNHITSHQVTTRYPSSASLLLAGGGGGGRLLLPGRGGLRGRDALALLAAVPGRLTTTIKKDTPLERTTVSRVDETHTTTTTHT